MTLHPDLLIPTDEVKAHIENLTRGGMSINEIARRAGLRYNSVYRLRQPRVEQVTARIATAVLAVRPTPGLSELARQATDCLRALISIGWTLQELARRTGLHSETLLMLALGKRKTVSYSTAEIIRATYDDLWDRPYTGPGATQARNRAARHGWPKPMELDL